MKKVNKKGFALIETLIVATFVLGIFTLIFTNYFPMMGEYEKRENYDDIDSVFNTYLIKKMLENSDSITYARTLTTGISNTSSNTKTTPINCNIYNNTDYADYCNNLFENTGVSSIILTSYNITNIKKSFTSNPNLKDYINTLPNYTNNPQGYTYRIIVQYKHTINEELKDGESGKYNYYSYSTIGVDL